jgi:hypothetical protein
MKGPADDAYLVLRNMQRAYLQRLQTALLHRNLHLGACAIYRKQQQKHDEQACVHALICYMLACQGNRNAHGVVFGIIWRESLLAIWSVAGLQELSGTLKQLASFFRSTTCNSYPMTRLKRPGQIVIGTNTPCAPLNPETIRQIAPKQYAN